MTLSSNVVSDEKIHDDITIDPKILEPYVPIPGRVPRKVALDRKKKEYASFHIEDLLTHEVRAILTSDSSAGEGVGG